MHLFTQKTYGPNLFPYLMKLIVSRLQNEVKIFEMRHFFHFTFPRSVWRNIRIMFWKNHIFFTFCVLTKSKHYKTSNWWIFLFQLCVDWIMARKSMNFECNHSDCSSIWISVTFICPSNVGCPNETTMLWFCTFINEWPWKVKNCVFYSNF